MGSSAGHVGACCTHAGLRRLNSAHRGDCRSGPDRWLSDWQPTGISRGMARGNMRCSRAAMLADYPYLEAADLVAVLEFAAKQSDHPVLRSA